MSGTVSLEYLQSVIGDGSTGSTLEGGSYQTFINDTGASSVKGMVVTSSSSVTNGVSKTAIASPLPLGIVYEAGVPNGQPVKVVTHGQCYALLADFTASNRGQWVGTAPLQGGRIVSLPVAGTIGAVGQCLETVSSGTDKLALIQVQL